MLLEVNGLVKRFGGLVAVRDVSLQVRPGQALGLIGPNGSGKTTVFNLITGFLKPDSGTVRLQGTDITGASPQRVCRLGMTRTFQHVKPFANLTVWQNLQVAAEYGHPAPAGTSLTERLNELLDLVELRPLAERHAKSLTLEQRKRLELARALAANPKLLLLDELMAGLTPAEQDAFVDLIRRILKSDVTIVMVEHIMRVVHALCDEVIVLNAGETIAAGEPDAVMRDKRVIEAYLGEGSHA